jgi:hypothetical protein
MSRVSEFNRRVALRVTAFVSTMWSAYFFAGIALISLPAAIRSGDTLIIVAWIAQTFLQLVLLSIIMVGQGVASAAVDKKIDETHEAVLVELAEVKAMAAEIHTILKDVESKK